MARPRPASGAGLTAAVQAVPVPVQLREGSDHMVEELHGPGLLHLALRVDVEPVGWSAAMVLGERLACFSPLGRLGLRFAG